MAVCVHTRKRLAAPEEVRHRTSSGRRFPMGTPQAVFSAFGRTNSTGGKLLEALKGMLEDSHGSDKAARITKRKGWPKSPAADSLACSWGCLLEGECHLRWRKTESREQTAGERGQLARSARSRFAAPGAICSPLFFLLFPALPISPSAKLVGAPGFEPGTSTPPV